MTINIQVLIENRETNYTQWLSGIKKIEPEKNNNNNLLVTWDTGSVEVYYNYKIIKVGMGIK